MLYIIAPFIPALLIVIAATGGFNPENFLAHKYRNSFIILMAITLPVTIHFMPEGYSSFVNYKPLLHKNILAMMDMVYGTSAIPPMKDDLPTKTAIAGSASLAVVEEKKKKRWISLGLKEALAQTSQPIKETIYYHRDHLGSVRVITNSYGNVWKRTDYLPFGEVYQDVVVNALTIPGYSEPKISYTGQERDINSSLYYYGARFYDAEIGRFIQGDNVSLPSDPQSINRYSYTGNNPLSFIDPTRNLRIPLGFGYIDIGFGYFGFGFVIPIGGNTEESADDSEDSPTGSPIGNDGLYFKDESLNNLSVFDKRALLEKYGKPIEGSKYEKLYGDILNEMTGVSSLTPTKSDNELVKTLKNAVTYYIPNEMVDDKGNVFSVLEAYDRLSDIIYLPEITIESRDQKSIIHEGTHKYDWKHFPYLGLGGESLASAVANKYWAEKSIFTNIEPSFGNLFSPQFTYNQIKKDSYGVFWFEFYFNEKIDASNVK